MKTLILTLTLILSSLLGSAQDKGQNITVTIDNVQGDKGKVSFALHTKDTFMKTAPVATLETKIENGKVKVVFKDIEPGEYAILVLHDANENGKMDFQENGMPLENFAASNNTMSYGPPQYSDAKFTLGAEDLKLNIRF
ncbi:DUF2141 domain-containing protein [Winogradskyella sp. A3E31]|uniref:DUF2141 domain-containing protein n=1 Tax=Winogradskyella sp. A3E31 TaxID=3349637 RepID=UPI00398AF4DB